MEKIHRIVIVGGGASGLELATQLGDRYQDRAHRFGKVHVTLIDNRAPMCGSPSCMRLLQAAWTPTITS